MAALLADQDGLARALVETLPDLVYVKDTQHRFILANPAVAELMGHRRPEDLIGLTDHDVHPPALADRYRADEEAVLAGGTIADRIEEVPDPDGGLRWMSTTKTALRGPDGRIVGVMGIGRDITARHAAEEALRQANACLESEVARRTADLRSTASRLDAANRAKDQFLAQISHEMRTPLNGILGMADHLACAALDGPERRAVETIRVSGRALLALIGDLLDLAAAEAGRITIRSDRFDVCQVLEEVVELLAPAAEDKGLVLALRIDPDLGPVRRGDAARLRQIVLNLAGNAVKFTRRGRVVVALAGDRLGLRLTVSDTGPGIPTAARVRVFSPFTRLDPAAPGTGLGLPIAARLAGLMGGGIAVADAPGGGTVFTVTAPIPGLAEPAVPGPLAGLPILAADNDPVAAGALADLIVRLGGEVRVASLVEAPDAAAGCALAVLSSPPADSAPVLAAAARMAVPVVGILPMRHTGRAPALRSVLHRPLRSAALVEACTSDRRRVTGTVTGIVPRDGAGRARVLVVDDNPVNRRVAALHLRRLGCRARCARNGRRALALCLPDAFDLLLLDLGMGGMDGLATARALRARLGEACPLLVGCTAGRVDGRQDDCRAAGMEELLAKPMDGADLARLVSRLRRDRGSLRAIPAADPPVRAAAADPVIDPQVLDRLRAMRGGDRLVATLVAHVLADCRAQPPRLAAALAADDLRAAAGAAHRLLGSARAAGLRRLATAAAAVERSCHAGTPMDCAELVTAIAEAEAELVARLEAGTGDRP
jgi:PAS domain S-box-containing protein